MLGFFAMQIDKLVFARIFPLADVGVYSIAASLAMVTATLMARMQGAITLPLYSRLMDRNESIAAVVLKTKTPILTIGGYLIALTIACSGSFIELAYDDRYQAARIYIPILAAGAWFGIVDGVYGAAFLALGQSRCVAIGNLAKLTFFGLILWPATYFWGLLGGVFAIAISDAIRVPVAFFFARQAGITNYSQDIKQTVYSYLVGFGVLGFVLELRVLDFVGPLVLLLAKALVVTLIYAQPLWVAYREINVPRKASY
jgi:O-antigen/teichoic acid export membrane protein